MGGGVSKRRNTRRSGRRKTAAMSEINVTPFVDVMLVLLIIFMVAAPMLTTGVPIELPETAATALPSEPQEPLTITLTNDGRVLLMSNEENESELITKLRAIASERDGGTVYVRADGAVPYADVAQVMGALNAAGFRDIGLVTDQGGPTMDRSVNILSQPSVSPN